MPRNKKTPAKPKAPRTQLKLEYRAAESLKPYAKNQRTHSPEQLDEIARSIESVGWTKPIIVDEKLEILAGHGAWQAAQQLGHTQVPIIVRAGLTPAQKKAYRIADNRIAEHAGWDDKLLAQEMAELKRMGFDMSLTGFNPSEIEFMLAPPLTDPGEPETPAIERRAVSKLGDLWLLGEHHRLLCGDATKPESYKTLMGGRQAQCVFTDPPYGVSYGEGRPTDRYPKTHKTMEGDQHRRGTLVDMLTKAFSSAMPSTREDASWYIWHGLVTRRDFEDAILACGLIEPPNGYIVWVKPATMGWSNYKSAFEPCFYVHRQGATPPFHGDRTHNTVWEASARTAAGASLELGSGIILSGAADEVLISAPAKTKGKTIRHQKVSPGEIVQIALTTDAANVWRVSRAKEGEDAIHPTQKPVELARRACRNSTLEGEIILDMFSGSGSTIMACEQTKRIGFGLEIDPHYVDAICRRYKGATGKKAIHAKEKKDFETIAEARGKA